MKENYRMLEQETLLENFKMTLPWFGIVHSYPQLLILTSLDPEALSQYLGDYFSRVLKPQWVPWGFLSISLVLSCFNNSNFEIE